MRTRGLFIVLFFSTSLLFSQIQTKSFQGFTNSTHTLTCDKYSGASLESVEIILTLSASRAYMGLDNDADYAQNIKAVFGLETGISSDQVRLFNEENLPIISGFKAVYEADITLSGDNGDGPTTIEIAGPDGEAITADNIQGQVSGKIADNYIEDFIGTGSFTVNVQVNNLFEMKDNENVTVTGAPIAFEGKIQIIYR